MQKALHVMFVFGTRPEAIKMAPVVRLLKARPEFKVTCLVTAQHREILDQVLELFHIEPDIDLNIMQANQTLTGITTRVLTGIEPILLKQRPDVLLVQGDTSTAFVAGLAAFYQKIPVGHIEAGLRTDKIYDPFPEEMNRRLLSRLTSIHFPPTQWALNNLAAEGIAGESVFLTGNTVADALRLICEELPEGLPEGLVELKPNHKMILIEMHRRENLGEPMQAICRALARLVENFSDIELVFSVHPNPKVREVIEPAMRGRERVHLLEPMPYPKLVRLMRAANFIMTDSGGLQEEAPSLGIPALVLRRTTERPEGIDSGNAILVGCDEETVYQQAAKLLTDVSHYQAMSSTASPYGDGHASERIAEALLYHFGHVTERPAEFSTK